MVVVVVVLLRQSRLQPYKSLWGLVGPTIKILKMKESKILEDEVVDNKYEQVSTSKSLHKILIKSLNFCKNLKCNF